MARRIALACMLIPMAAATFPVAAAGPALPATTDATTPDAIAPVWTVRDDAALPSPGVELARPVEIDWNVIERVRVGDRVRFDLPGGDVVIGVLGRRAMIGPERMTIAGHLESTLPARFTLSVYRTAVAGLIEMGVAGTYRLRGSIASGTVIESIDMDTLPWCDLEEATPFDAGLASPPAEAFAGNDEGGVIDLLVVYTREARDAAGGTDGINAEIDLMVANMNDALAGAEIAPRISLVYARELATPESLMNLSSLTSPFDGIADGVHALRDAYGADQVALVRSGGGGVAHGLRDLDPDSAATAFCENGRDSLPFIIAHEVGHNLGCCHAVGDGGGCSVGLLFPFSNGHRFFGDSGFWRTVMAYSPGQWSAIYSNPAVEFDGVATGIAGDTGAAADNARTITLSTPAVAGWRCHAPICAELDLTGDAFDCDEDGVPDACAIALAWSTDVDGNGLPDDCECPADADGDGGVGITDLLIVLASWNDQGGPGDVDGDGTVGFGDMLAVLADWGPCFDPAGACCFDAGTCLAMTEAACAESGGVFQGVGTACQDACPRGACCFPDGTCDPRTEERCLREGGMFQGPDAGVCVCGPGACRPADDCADAPVVGPGVYGFSTLDSTTDGPDLPAACDEGSGVTLGKDVWMWFVADCDGMATASVCDATFDTRLAVYDDAGCSGELLACDDDSCGDDGTRSETSFAVTAGGRYLVRIGLGDTVERGEGTLTLSCGGG
ncbi:MAG: hypothetical protein HKN62_07970 [Phycisphaerales bacterium]|nr:hypothetical protein [Phycisphaerales bacterium]